MWVTPEEPVAGVNVTAHDEAPPLPVGEHVEEENVPPASADQETDPAPPGVIGEPGAVSTIVARQVNGIPSTPAAGQEVEVDVGRGIPTAVVDALLGRLSVLPR
jgi:hypothetical protein